MPSKLQRGFTLLELMITLGVLAILSVMAYPNMRDMIRRDRVVSQSNNLQGDLQMARGQAAAMRTYVSICPLVSAGGTGCSDTSENYDLGWLVYTSTVPATDYDGIQAHLLRIVAAPQGVSIRADQPGVLSFDARGQVLISGSPDASVNFISCAKASHDDSIGTNTPAAPGIELNVSSSGRVASSPLSAGAACEDEVVPPAG